jgi:flagellum-specific ATP synthase
VTSTATAAGGFAGALTDRLPAARAAALPRRTGQVVSVVGLSAVVAGLDAAVGDIVQIVTGSPAHGADAGSGRVAAEVVAVSPAGLTCLPLGGLTGLRPGAEAYATGAPLLVPAGDALLGRVLDGLGRPIDDGPPLEDVHWVGVDGTPPHPLRRSRVERQLSLGVRALDTLVPCGRGQRIGIFAGSGVGKSSLLSMITKGTDADVRVICLVGERGREVREFLEDNLGPEGMARSVVVVATSDSPPMTRLKAAFVATRIAEHFRDEGRDVLLLLDSITRMAMAQREVGLSAGEPPATRGYPPSVFAMLPRLMERAGASDRGTITALYTVLVEGDDMNEPIGDTARSILDGHIVLDRRLAHAGHYPSIDVLASVSRVESMVTTPEQREAARELRRLLAAYRDAKELIDIGAYVPGSNPAVDRARELAAATDGFLRQRPDDVVPAEVAWDQLRNLLGAA